MVAFLPHGYCILWQPGLLWLHVVSDALIALAYFSIPVFLAILLLRRHDTPYVWTFVMFGLFITFCGATHVIEIVNIWIPVYWIDGYVKAGTALISLMTAAMLGPLLPKLIKLPSPNIDTLTGLPNRALLVDRLDVAIARLKRDDAGILAVLFLDLDGFKAVNDSLGHDRGDELLASVAKRLKRIVRTVDTVARFGGDEFVVLLERIDGPSYAETVARRIVSELELPFTLGATSAGISACVGIVVSDGSDSREALVAAADAAMYRAKAKGRGTCELSDRRTEGSQVAPGCTPT